MTANQRATINGISTFGILFIVAGIGVLILASNPWGTFMALFGFIVMISISVASAAINKANKPQTAPQQS